MKFKLYKEKPNDIKFGKLYVTSLDVPFDDTKRTIRVYVPKGYDENDKSKRYKVLYMSDGQNIVDKYTSAYGAWDLDVVVNNLTLEGYEPPIIVGIDSPKSDIKRTNELCSPVPTNKKGINISSPIGNQFVDFVFDVVKPLVDSTFNTLSDKENTGIGGSSMGGLMAFYAYAYKKDKVGFSLCFSPAFFLYKKDIFLEGLRKWKPSKKDYGKIFFFVGGKEFESLFVNRTLDMYSYLKKCGFKDDQVAIIYDSLKGHHESSWHIYSYDALRFWLNKTK